MGEPVEGSGEAGEGGSGEAGEAGEGGGGFGRSREAAWRERSRRERSRRERSRRERSRREPHGGMALLGTGQAARDRAGQTIFHDHGSKWALFGQNDP